MAASIQPAEIGCKMTNYLSEGLGRRDLGNYDFYLIQLNRKKTSVTLMLRSCHVTLSHLGSEDLGID